MNDFTWACKVCGAPNKDEARSTDELFDSPCDNCGTIHTIQTRTEPEALRVISYTCIPVEKSAV